MEQMNEYMIEIFLPKEFTPEFISRIPEQRLQVNRLMQQGVLTSYALTFDRSRLWITMIGKSREEVVAVLRTFPLYAYFRYEIMELAFHNSPAQMLPQVSLN